MVEPGLHSHCLDLGLPQAYGDALQAPRFFVLGLVFFSSTLLFEIIQEKQLKARFTGQNCFRPKGGRALID